MNRAEFTKAVAENGNISRTRAYKSVTLVIETIRKVVSAGEDVEIGGFGTFHVLTDQKGGHILVFNAGKVLNKAINCNASNK